MSAIKSCSRTKISKIQFREAQLTRTWFSGASTLLKTYLPEKKMLKPLQIVALEQKLDYAISKFDTEAELFVQSHLGRYLAILTAGNSKRSNGLR